MEHDEKEFTVAPGICRLVRPGPPNMRFCDGLAQSGGIAAAAAIPAAPLVPASEAGAAVAAGHPFPTVPLQVPASTAINDGESNRESVGGDSESDELTAAQVTAAVEAAYNFFIRECAGWTKLSKAAFRQAIAEKLVRNTFVPGGLAVAPAVTSPDCENDHPHQLRTVPKHGGRYKGGLFPTIKAAYVKWPCYLCKRKVRTYCACNLSKIVCSVCWHVHVTITN